MTKRPFYLIVPLAVVCAVVIIVIFYRGMPGEIPSVDSMAPRTALTDLVGKNMTIPDDFRGKVILIHFWASSCPLCVREIRSLESLHRRYETRGLVPLSVNIGESRQSALSYLKGIDVSYPVLLDSDMSVTRQYGVKGVPTTYVLDREGIIRFRFLGEITSEGLEKMVRTLL